MELPDSYPVLYALSAENQVLFHATMFFSTLSCAKIDLTAKSGDLPRKVSKVIRI
jgi:hypothetical protein